MATGSGGSKVRIIVLLVILAAVGVCGWYVMSGRAGFGGFGGGGIEATVVNGDLLGKKLEDATAAPAAQPVNQPNPDGEKSTAKIYLYTLTGQKPERSLVRVRVAANGSIIATKFVDASGNVINVESPK